MSILYEDLKFRNWMEDLTSVFLSKGHAEVLDDMEVWYDYYELGYSPMEAYLNEKSIY